MQSGRPAALSDIKVFGNNVLIKTLVSQNGVGPNLGYIKGNLESYTGNQTLLQVVKQWAMMGCKCSLDEDPRNIYIVLV